MVAEFGDVMVNGRLKGKPPPSAINLPLTEKIVALHGFRQKINLPLAIYYSDPLYEFAACAQLGEPGYGSAEA